MDFYKVISDKKIIFKNKINLENGATTYNSYNVPKNTIIQYVRQKILDSNNKYNDYYFKIIKCDEDYLENLISIWWSPTLNGIPIIDDNIEKLDDNNLKIQYNLLKKNKI